jgi:hypothetical protein
MHPVGHKSDTRPAGVSKNGVPYARNGVPYARMGTALRESLCEVTASFR